MKIYEVTAEIQYFIVAEDDSADTVAEDVFIEAAMSEPNPALITTFEILRLKAVLLK